HGSNLPSNQEISNAHNAEELRDAPVRVQPEHLTPDVANRLVDESQEATAEWMQRWKRIEIVADEPCLIRMTVDKHRVVNRERGAPSGEHSRHRQVLPLANSDVRQPPRGDRQ